jgi:hypothetical protein
VPLGSSDAKLFINYRREDTAPYAGRLHDRLAAHFGQDQVFIDIDQIEFGEDFVEVINRKLDACEIAIILIGPNWLGAMDATGNRRLDDNEDFVRMEIIAVLERKIRVIPVLVGGARMPRKYELPEILAPLSRRNGIELGGTRFHADVSRLIEAIEKTRSFPGKKTERLPERVASIAESASLGDSRDPENLQATSALRRLADKDVRLKVPKILKSVLGVIFGYIVMAVFAFATFTSAYLLLGVDRAFEAESYTVSTLWMVLMIAVAIIGGILGGLTCAATSKSKVACMAFAIILLALGLIVAIPAAMKERPATARPSDVPNLQAMQMAQTPTWLLLLNPVLGATSVVVGARMKKLPTR